MINKPILIICLFFFIANHTYCQKKYLFLYGDTNIRPAYTIGAEAQYYMEGMTRGMGIDLIHGPTVGLEIAPFKEAFIIPKAGYKCSILYPILQANSGVLMITDFHQNDFRWESGIELSLFSIINIGYKYNVPFRQENKFQRVSANNITIQFLLYSNPKYRLTFM